MTTIIADPYDDLARAVLLQAARDIDDWQDLTREDAARLMVRGLRPWLLACGYVREAICCTDDEIADAILERLESNEARRALDGHRCINCRHCVGGERVRCERGQWEDYARSTVKAKFDGCDWYNGIGGE